MSINLTNEPNTNLGDKLLVWQFPEWRELKRSAAWWITAIIIVTALLIYSIVDGNFLFAAIVLIGLIIIWTDSRRPPHLLDLAIHQQGLVLGQRFWPWRELNYFWLVYRPPEIAAIYIQPKSAWQPRLGIPLENTNPLKVREILTKYLREDLEREDIPTSESLSRMLKLR